jgi:hypothetical protein
MPHRTLRLPGRDRPGSPLPTPQRDHQDQSARISVKLQAPHTDSKWSGRHKYAFTPGWRAVVGPLPCRVAFRQPRAWRASGSGWRELGHSSITRPEEVKAIAGFWSDIRKPARFLPSQPPAKGGGTPVPSSRVRYADGTFCPKARAPECSPEQTGARLISLGAGMGTRL